MDPVLSEADVAKMTTPLWEQAKSAIGSGEPTRRRRRSSTGRSRSGAAFRPTPSTG